MTVEADELDAVAAELEALRQVIVTDTATLRPPVDNLIKMVPVRWRIDKTFYIFLALSMGYEISITTNAEEETGQDFTAGVSGAGDTLGYTEDTELPYIWDILIYPHDAEPIPAPELEALLEDLKPAHRKLIFHYPGE